MHNNESAIKLTILNINSSLTRDILHKKLMFKVRYTDNTAEIFFFSLPPN